MDIAPADSIELNRVSPSLNSRTFSVQDYGPESSLSSLLLSRHSGLDRQPSQHHSSDHFVRRRVDDLPSIICMCSSCLHRKAFWERQYNRLKHRLASYRKKGRANHSDEQAQQPLFSFDELLSYWAFGAPGIDDEPTSSQAGRTLHNADIRAREGDTISIWVGQVVSTLQTVIPDGLQLCVLSEVRPPEEARPFIRLGDRVRSFLLGEPNIKNLPVDIVMDIIGNIWQMEIPPWSAEAAQDTIYGSAQSLPLLYPPSKNKSNDVLRGSGQNHSPSRTWGQVPRREGNMDPYLKDNEILLHWQLETPWFWTDWYTYIVEIHKTLPQPQYAKLMLSPKNDQTGCRLLIHFGHRHNFREFVTRMNKSGATQGKARTDISDEEYWSPDAIIIISIISIFEMMIDDTTNFIQKFHREVKSFSVKCRRSPSTSKMKFSLHLEDYRKMSHAGVQRGLAILKVMDTWIEKRKVERPQYTGDAGTSFETRIDDLRKDLEFFDKTLESLKIHLQDDRKQLQDRFEITQQLRSFRIAILAAIFLPLSFTTSIFGMNMVTDAPDGPEGFSDWAQTALKQVPDNLLNATEVLASTIGTSGALNYTWKSFGITATCLVLTLPLTLGMGVLLRFITSTQWSVVLVRALVISCFLMIGAFGGFGHFASIIFGWGRGVLLLSFLFKVVALMFIVFRAVLQTHRARLTKTKKPKRHWAGYILMSLLLLANMMLTFGDPDDTMLVMFSYILGFLFCSSWLALLGLMVQRRSVL